METESENKRKGRKKEGGGEKEKTKGMGMVFIYEQLPVVGVDIFAKQIQARRLLLHAIKGEQDSIFPSQKRV